MKKIDEKRALELINAGIFPKCEVERDLFRPIRTSAELEDYKNKSPFQGFILWGYTDSEIKDFSIPDSAIEINLDEALRLIIDNEKIYGKVIAHPEICFTTRTELLDFYKKHLNSGDSFHLFWKG